MVIGQVMDISMLQLFVAPTPVEGWGKYPHDGTTLRFIVIVSVGALALTLCVALSASMGWADGTYSRCTPGTRTPANFNSVVAQLGPSLLLCTVSNLESYKWRPSEIAESSPPAGETEPPGVQDREAA
jgi:hypothetical protein